MTGFEGQKSGITKATPNLCRNQPNSPYRKIYYQSKKWKEFKLWAILQI